MNLLNKVLDDFLVLTGFKSIDGPTSADYIRHDLLVKYFAKKGKDYSINCSELMELDKAYMRYC